MIEGEVATKGRQQARVVMPAWGGGKQPTIMRCALATRGEVESIMEGQVGKK